MYVVLPTRTADMRRGVVQDPKLYEQRAKTFRSVNFLQDQSTDRVDLPSAPQQRTFQGDGVRWSGWCTVECDGVRWSGWCTVE